MKRHIVLLSAVLVLVVTGLFVTAFPAAAAPPELVNYQGILTDQTGNPLSGNHTLTFKIYRDSLSVTPIIWSETQANVPVTNGLFNVLLGRVVPLTVSALAASASRWLGVKVDADAEMAPRMRFTSVPWALHSAIADSALTGPATSDADWIISGINQYSGVSGNVGIGTSLPGKKLQIGSSTTANSEGMVRLASRSGTNGSFRIWDVGVPETDAVSSGYGYSFVIDDTDFGTDPEFMVKWGTGRVGIGTNAPARKLHIDGANVADGIRIAWGSDYPTVFGEITHGLGSGLVINSSAGGGTWADITFQTNGTTKATLTSAGYLGIGTATPTAMLEVAGTAKVQILQITGADLAEKFPVTEPAEPGMVVAIDPDRPGQMCLARGEYNRRVAGVISGAGDLPAGAILGNLPGHEKSLPMALSGRVWVRCDASSGPITPGDLLTTSAVAGVAMKASDATRSPGATLGKAMSSLAEGRGLVLTLVSLQ